MRTAQQIKDDAIGRYYASRQSYGMLNRQDIIDFFAQLPPEKDKKTELKAFMDTLPFLTFNDKEKTLDDLKSYGVT